MSEPWPPAFMRTAPPTEPGTPTAHESPDQPASATRRASTGRARAAPARTVGRTPGPAPRSWTGGRDVRQSQPGEAEPRRRTSPSKPASATKRFDPRPITKTAMLASTPSPAASSLAAGGPDPLEVLGTLRFGEERRRTTHSVGGQRPEWLISHGSWTKGVGQGGEERGRRHHDGDRAARRATR